MDEILTVAKLGGVVTLDTSDSLAHLHTLHDAGFIEFNYSVTDILGIDEYHANIKSLIQFSIACDGRTHHLKPDQELLLTIY